MNVETLQRSGAIHVSTLREKAKAGADDTGQGLWLVTEDTHFLTDVTI